MCSRVTLRPARGSISVFHIPLNKNPAENETAGFLISDLFSEKQTFPHASASLWHIWCCRKQHLSCVVLSQNLWKSTCAFLNFKSVCQMWLKLIICVSCRLAFQAWLLLLLVVWKPVVLLPLPSFCQQQLYCVSTLSSTKWLPVEICSWPSRSSIRLKRAQSRPILLDLSISVSNRVVWSGVGAVGALPVSHMSCSTGVPEVLISAQTVRKHLREAHLHARQSHWGSPPDWSPSS